jgi:hypothetical protein
LLETLGLLADRIFFNLAVESSNAMIAAQKSGQLFGERDFHRNVHRK